MEWLAALRSNIGKANGRKQRVRADGSGKKAAAAIAAAAVGAAVRSPRSRQLQNQTASLADRFGSGQAGGVANGDAYECLSCGQAFVLPAGAEAVACTHCKSNFVVEKTS